MVSSKNNTAVRGSNGDGEKGEANLSEDVKWLSSLSESELDFFICLKELAIRRAKNAGCKDLAEKFDARMLRALGIVLMEHFKAYAESASIPTNVLETSALLRDCNLVTSNHDKNSGSVTFSEDVGTSSFVSPRRKRMWDGLMFKYEKCTEGYRGTQKGFVVMLSLVQMAHTALRDHFFTSASCASTDPA